MWFGAIFVANAIAMAMGYADFIPSGELSEVTSLGVGLLMWGIRFYTTKPVALLGE